MPHSDLPSRTNKIIIRVLQAKITTSHPLHSYWSIKPNAQIQQTKISIPPKQKQATIQQRYTKDPTNQAHKKAHISAPRTKFQNPLPKEQTPAPKSIAPLKQQQCLPDEITPQPHLFSISIPSTSPHPSSSLTSLRIPCLSAPHQRMYNKRTRHRPRQPTKRTKHRRRPRCAQQSTSGTHAPHPLNTRRHRNEPREPEDRSKHLAGDYSPAVVRIWEEHGREDEVGEDDETPYGAEDEEVGFGVAVGDVGAVGAEAEDDDSENPVGG